MQLCARRSSGVEITGCLATYSGDATVTIRYSLKIRTATMSFSMHSPTRMPASIRFVDDVSLGIIRDDLKRNVGVFAQEHRHKGRDDRYGNGAYDAQPQSSARVVAKAVHRIKR